MHRVFRPHIGTKPGLLVISGLDGAGKSTQAELLSARLAEEGRRVRVIWNRWEPYISAPLIRVARRRISRVRNAQTEDYTNFTEAKRRRMRNPILRILWQLMVWGEYSLQVNFRMAKNRDSSAGTVCDRYIYDTLVDVAVNFDIPRGGISRLLGHPILSFFPRPAAVIFIDIDPRLGALRKNDGTPAEYLADRREHYQDIASMMGAPIIDGGGTIDEISKKIWELTGQWRDSIPVTGIRPPKTGGDP